MNMLASLATDDTIANERDSVGGDFSPFDSGAYKFTVDLAYLGKAASGALSLNVTLKTEDGRELRQTFWMTSGTDKGCKNYFEKDGEKRYLPGFVAANALCLLTVGKEISALDTEEKVIKLWNYESKSEVPTKVPMIVDLLGQEIVAGVLKQTVDKNRKNEVTGKYEATGETREENEIDKFFRARDNKTTAEIRAQAEEAVFFDQWKAKWEGKVKNKAKGAAAGSGTAGMPKASGGSMFGGAPATAAQATKKPATSLFG